MPGAESAERENECGADPDMCLSHDCTIIGQAVGRGSRSDRMGIWARCAWVHAPATKASGICASLRTG